MSSVCCNRTLNFTRVLSAKPASYCQHARKREIQTARQFRKTLKALSSRCQGRVELHRVFLHRQGTYSAPFGEGALRQALPDLAADGAGGSDDGVACHEN